MHIIQMWVSILKILLLQMTLVEPIGSPVADSGTVTVSPGYIEEPHNLVAQDGMDAQVLLTWDAPYGPIPADFEEDFEEGEIPEGWEVITNGNGWFM